MGGRIVVTLIGLHLELDKVTDLCWGEYPDGFCDKGDPATKFCCYGIEFVVVLWRDVFEGRDEECLRCGSNIGAMLVIDKVENNKATWTRIPEPVDTFD